MTVLLLLNRACLLVTFGDMWWKVLIFLLSILPATGRLLCRTSGGQATTGCPPGYSAECEESLSGPYSVESGKDIDGYPYEKCG